MNKQHIIFLARAKAFHDLRRELSVEIGFNSDDVMEIVCADWQLIRGCDYELNAFELWLQTEEGAHAYGIMKAIVMAERPLETLIDLAIENVTAKGQDVSHLESDETQIEIIRHDERLNEQAPLDRRTELRMCPTPYGDNDNIVEFPLPICFRGQVLNGNRHLVDRRVKINEKLECVVVDQHIASEQCFDLSEHVLCDETVEGRIATYNLVGELTVVSEDMFQKHWTDAKRRFEQILDIY